VFAECDLVEQSTKLVHAAQDYLFCVCCGRHDRESSSALHYICDYRHLILQRARACLSAHVDSRCGINGHASLVASEVNVQLPELECKVSVDRIRMTRSTSSFIMILCRRLRTTAFGCSGSWEPSLTWTSCIFSFVSSVLYCQWHACGQVIYFDSCTENARYLYCSALGRLCRPRGIIFLKDNACREGRAFDYDAGAALRASLSCGHVRCDVSCVSRR